MGNFFGAQRIEGTRWLGWLDAAAWGPTPAFSLEELLVALEKFDG